MEHLWSFCRACTQTYKEILSRMKKREGIRKYRAFISCLGVVNLQSIQPFLGSMRASVIGLEPLVSSADAPS